MQCIPGPGHTWEVGYCTSGTAAPQVPPAELLQTEDAADNEGHNVHTPQGFTFLAEN